MACAPGNFRAQGGGCSPCATGTASRDGRAALACFSCTGATFAPGQGAVACSACPPGWYANKKHTTCTPCDEGMQVGLDGISCTPCIGWGCVQALCPPGVVPGVGDPLACRPCHGPACGNCAPGTVLNANGSGCVPCVGDLVSNANGTACVSCPVPGTAAADDHARCVPCQETGRVVSADGLRCVQCGGATVAVPGATGRGTCEPCPGGSVPDAVHGACVRCGAGAVPVGGGTYCAACPGATVPSSDGTVCEACPAGAVPVPACTGCVACPDGMHPTRDGLTCEAGRPHRIHAASAATTSAHRAPRTQVPGWGVAAALCAIVGIVLLVVVLRAFLRNPRMAANALTLPR